MSSGQQAAAFSRLGSSSGSVAAHVATPRQAEISPASSRAAAAAAAVAAATASTSAISIKQQLLDMDQALDDDAIEGATAHSLAHAQQNSGRHLGLLLDSHLSAIAAKGGLMDSDSERNTANTDRPDGLDTLASLRCLPVPHGPAPVIKHAVGAGQAAAGLGLCQVEPLHVEDVVVAAAAEDGPVGLRLQVEMLESSVRATLAAKQLESIRGTHQSHGSVAPGDAPLARCAIHTVHGLCAVVVAVAMLCKAFGHIISYRTVS